MVFLYQTFVLNSFRIVLTVVDADADADADADGVHKIFHVVIPGPTNCKDHVPVSKDELVITNGIPVQI